MTTAAMKVCPMCDKTPKMAGLFQFQVRCSCGVCGPKMHSEDAAVTRWNSVAYFVRKLRASNLTPDSRFDAIAC
jgi:hypothetical protein